MKGQLRLEILPSAHVIMKKTALLSYRNIPVYNLRVIQFYLQTASVVSNLPD